MKRTSTLFTAAVVLFAAFAHGEATKPGQPPAGTTGNNPGLGINGEFDFSGKAALSNPALMKEIDDTLIRGASCRSMAPLGYGNGYQCPAAGVAACTKMMMAGKVDACAQLKSRDYPAGCSSQEGTPEGRANSTCSDLSADLWGTLAIRVPYNFALRRLLAFGCKAEQGTTVFCPSHIREWLCQPFERGGVVVCRPPKLVQQCSGNEFKTCVVVET